MVFHLCPAVRAPCAGLAQGRSRKAWRAASSASHRLPGDLHPGSRAGPTGGSTDDPTLPPTRRLHRHPAEGQPAGRRPCRARAGRRDDGGLRTLDQPVGDHLPAAADDSSRRRLPRAHLHAGRRTALRRPPHAGQLPRLAGCRRGAARAPTSWCRNAGSASCASGATARGWPSRRRRCAAAGRWSRRCSQRIAAALRPAGRATSCSTSGWTTARAGAR